MGRRGIRRARGHRPGPRAGLPGRRGVQDRDPERRGVASAGGRAACGRGRGHHGQPGLPGQWGDVAAGQRARDMAQAGLDAGVEVCLFVGPRERFGIGAHARSATGGRTGTRSRPARAVLRAGGCAAGDRGRDPQLPGRRPGAAPGGDAGAGPGRAAGRAGVEGLGHMSPTSPVTLKVLEETGPGRSTSRPT